MIATGDEFHGVRASLLYLNLILSDEFKNAYYHTFNKDGLKRLIEKERAYTRHQILGRNDLKIVLLDNLSEIEYKMYMEFVSSDYVKYEGYL